MSVVQPQFAGVLGQALECGRLLLAHLVGAGHQVIEGHTPVGTDQAMREPAGLDLLDHEGARHIEQVGCPERRVSEAAPGPLRLCFQDGPPKRSKCSKCSKFIGCNAVVLRVGASQRYSDVWARLRQAFFAVPRDRNSGQRAPARRTPDAGRRTPDAGRRTSAELQKICFATIR